MSFGFLKFTSTDLSLHQCSDFEGCTILQCKRGAEAPQQFSTHRALSSCSQQTAWDGGTRET